MYIHLSCLLGQYQLRIILFFCATFCNFCVEICLVFVLFLSFFSVGVALLLPYLCSLFIVLENLYHTPLYKLPANIMNALPPFSHSFYFWLYSGGHICKYKLYECSPTVLFLYNPLSHERNNIFV